MTTVSQLFWVVVETAATAGGEAGSDRIAPSIETDVKRTPSMRSTILLRLQGNGGRSDSFLLLDFRLLPDLSTSCRTGVDEVPVEGVLPGVPNFRRLPLMYACASSRFPSVDCLASHPVLR